MTIHVHIFLMLENIHEHLGFSAHAKRVAKLRRLTLNVHPTNYDMWTDKYSTDACMGFNWIYVQQLRSRPGRDKTNIDIKTVGFL